MLELLLVVGVFFLLWMGLMYLYTQRAIKKVVRIFREQEALDRSSAKTVQELGIKKQTPLERMYKMPDHTYRTMEFLVLKDVIKVTGEEKLYLSEDSLAQFQGKSSG